MPPNFLVLDFHAESRYLLVKTLLRKFPEAVIHECDDAERAVELVQSGSLAAIVTHRTFDVSGVDLVRRFREVDSNVTIIMVSGIDREQAAREAGANSFLPYDEWLRIGTVVESHLAEDSKESNRQNPS